MRGLRALQFVSSLLHLLSSFGELLIAAITREFFKLSSHLLRFVDHFLLLPLRASAAPGLLLSLRAHLLLELLLLTAREFGKPSRDFILLLTLILLLLPLNRLVLVLHFVELKLKKIGEFLLILLTLALTLAAALRNLDLAEDRFRAQQLLQRSLLRRKRFFGLFGVQFNNRGGHFLRSLPNILDKLCIVRLRVDLISEPPANSLGERLGIGLQFFLAKGHRAKILVLLRRCVCGELALNPKSSGDNLPLAACERVGFLIALSLPLPLLLGLPELAIERPHLHEVNVAG